MCISKSPILSVHSRFIWKSWGLSWFALTARILAVHADPERPLPPRTFEGEQMTLEVGDKTIELMYPSPNHDTGNILVYAPRHRLAQMSDVVMPGWAPYRGWGNADYPPGILLAHDAILKVDSTPSWEVTSTGRARGKVAKDRGR